MKGKLLLLLVISVTCLASVLAWQSPIFLSSFDERPAAPVEIAPQGPDSRGGTEARSGPTHQTLTLGQSCGKRPLLAHVIGSGKRSILILGGTHGDEPASASVAEALVASLQDDPMMSDVTVVIVPTVNPDGLLARTRVNGCGVDVNRNFPTKSWRADSPDKRHNSGPKPASEPETLLIMSLIEKYSPELLISIHAPLGCVNWDGPAEGVAAVMSQANGYPLKKDIGYPTPGSLGTYAGIERNIPTITLELRPANLPDLIRENLPALRAAITHLALPQP